MQEALKMSRSQPVYVWILGGGAIVLGILLCFSFFLNKSLTWLYMQVSAHADIWL